MIKRIWFSDKCHAIKSCAGVVLIGAALSGMFLIIRLVGEKRFQEFLYSIFVFKRGDLELDLVSGALAPENRAETE